MCPEAWKTRCSVLPRGSLDLGGFGAWLLSPEAFGSGQEFQGAFLEPLAAAKGFVEAPWNLRRPGVSGSFLGAFVSCQRLQECSLRLLPGSTGSRETLGGLLAASTRFQRVHGNAAGTLMGETKVTRHFWPTFIDRYQRPPLPQRWQTISSTTSVAARSSIRSCAHYTGEIIGRTALGVCPHCVEGRGVAVAVVFEGGVVGLSGGHH